MTIFVSCFQNGCDNSVTQRYKGQCLEYKPEPEEPEPVPLEEGAVTFPDDEEIWGRM